MSTEIQYTPELIERFYAKVSTIPTEQGCLEWMAYHNAFGHGIFGIGNGRTEGAHRIAWELVNGPIPKGLVLRHFVCNNPRCCNVEHFLLGTPADNTQDMIDSGRFKNAPNTRAPYVRPVGPTVAERFYAKVSKTPTETGCLEWTAGLRNGYGYFNPDGTNVYAHRFAWELVNGHIPPGMYACHACDNRKCCNPAHIFIGTPTENAHDRDRKGRTATNPNPGESNGNSKLTAEQVREIRSQKYADWYDGDIAAEFGVSRTLIAGVLSCRSWRHLDGNEDTPILDRQPKGEWVKNAKLTDDVVREIRGDTFAGWTQREIAEHFGVSGSVISNVRNHKAWVHV